MSSNLMRKYIDILDEAVRVGSINAKGALERPETQDERDELASKVKQTRKYNRDMMSYLKNPGVSDQGTDAEQANFEPFQSGIASAQTYDSRVKANNPAARRRDPMAGATGVPTQKGKVGAIDTKDPKAKVNTISGQTYTSRWDGREDPQGRSGVVTPHPMAPKKPTLTGLG